MNRRERVLTALRHKEPDRVPIDFGGTIDTSVIVPAYRALRGYLGLHSVPPRVSEVMTQVVTVDEEVREAMGGDIDAITYEPKEWREDTEIYGFPIMLPAQFEAQLRNDGSRVILDSLGNVNFCMPKGGYYFDLVNPILANAASIDELDKHLDEIRAFDRPSYNDLSCEELARRAKDLRHDTDYLLVGVFGGHIFQAGQMLRGWENFLVDLIANPRFAEALMDRLLEGHVEALEHYCSTVGTYVDVILVEDDLGMQDRPLLSPTTYRRMVKPYHQKLWNLVKSKTGAFLLLHSCGAVSELIPDFIEMGIDALNPVQVSASGMDSKRLKQEFGRDIAFWGGGVDTQGVLAFGSSDEVRDEVRRRIDDFAPGGGFVCTHVHNIQPGVPPENVAAMYETIREYGVY